jgi:hypothetical protein
MVDIHEVELSAKAQGQHVRKHRDGRVQKEARMHSSQRESSKAVEFMTFWKTPKALLEEPANPGYLTFETDIGGLNNIRMGFEYVVELAIRSGRTVVLPAKEGWYLLDWGPLNAHGADEEWIKPGTSSSFEEFWDIKDLSRHVPVISATEFYKRMAKTQDVSGTVDPATLPVVNAPDKSSWKTWLQKHGTAPSDCIDGENMALDKSVEHMHIPISWKTSEQRFFDCDHMKISDTSKGQELLHFNPSFLELASDPVDSMKFGHYAALHLRRNEFQFVQAPGVNGSDALLEDAEKVMKAGEPVYIASDEVDPSWWDMMTAELQQRGHRLVSIRDFKDDLEKKGVTRRTMGLVEMNICAGARTFLGTTMSTFSSGIQEIRDKIAASNKERLASPQLLEVATDDFDAAATLLDYDSSKQWVSTQR